MSSKVKIYNMALSALLLSRQVTDPDSEINTNEVRVLNQFWDDALSLVLQELDLDCLSERIPLELIEELDEGPWNYVYRYPDRCAFLRRIESPVITDNSSTHIAKRVGIYQDQKAIFTNEYAAIGECIPLDVSLTALTVHASFAVSYMLAFLSAPLLAGKGAKSLREEIYKSYQLSLMKAQEHDKLENFSYDSPAVRSEFVAARLE